MAGRNNKGLVALSGIRKNGNRTRVRFPSIAPTGIERLNADNWLQAFVLLSPQSSRQEFLDIIGQRWTMLQPAEKSAVWGHGLGLTKMVYGVTAEERLLLQ
jgi:hypothetical protein